LTPLAFAPGVLKTTLGVLGVRDVVDARAGARDGQKPVAGLQLVHLGGAHENGVGFGEVFGACVVFGQVFQPHIRNRIEAVVLVVHFLLLSSVEFILECAATHGSVE